MSWQEDLLHDFSFMSKKLEELEKFTGGEEYPELDLDQAALVRAQLVVLRAYHGILKERAALVPHCPQE